MKDDQILFRTQIAVRPNPAKIDLDSAILSIGSCFADTIAEKLQTNTFDILQNPTGACYNPLSIASILMRHCEKRAYGPDDLFYRQGLWRCFDFHTGISDSDQAGFVSAVQRQSTAIAARLDSIDTLIITLGTAWVYRLARDGSVVSNCHKLPQSEFTRTLAPVESIISSLDTLFAAIVSRRPQCTIILTVSPIRHLRDDPHENTVSKAHCIAAVYAIEKKYQENCYYFPSYEIMNDELRDYRFYADDMIHPSPVAVDYIWRRFTQACLSDRAKRFVGDYAPIRNARGHAQGEKQSPLKTQFARKHISLLKELAKIYPEANLNDDFNYFSTLL